MAEKEGIYKCHVCGNVVSVIEAHEGVLVCCGKEMELMKAKTEDEGKEKHVPVLEKSEGKTLVKIGSVPHPMEEKHFIELVQLFKDGKMVAEKRLTFTDKPEANFCEDGDEARIYCNIHGLWRG